MTTWFISRHPGALHWMKANDIAFDHHLTHLENETIQAGDRVIGSLPVNLAAELCAKGVEYWNLSLILPEGARGKELSANELDSYQAKLEAFNISANTKAVNPAIAVSAKKSSIKEQPIEATEESATAPRTQPKQQDQPIKRQDSFNFNELKQDLFRAFIWKQNNQDEAEKEAERLLDNARILTQNDPAMMAELDRIIRLGRHAVNMTSGLLKRIRNGEAKADLQAWIEQQKTSQSPRIIRHLQIELDKKFNFSNKKATQAKQNKSFNITLPQTQLVNGQHPQSIRALVPAPAWDIYIDETGVNFSASASELNESDTNLGRIIALALPHGHQLAELKTTHATDLPHKEIQDLLLAITQARCGILGATLKQDLFSHNWMSAVHQLARWLLLMLPMNQSATRVRIHIENRTSFNNSKQLEALQETLNSELQSLLPERFKWLNLSLHIMSKDASYNGYVDAIANCWGSSDQTKRKMLARTLWRGSCLLQTNNVERIEDIYRSISTGEQVSGHHWYELCSAASQEPEHSLLHDMLQKLGEQCQQQPALWQSYLTQVQTRVERKNYTPKNLELALQFLAQYHSNEPLPAYLQLELYSLQLASGNHQGEANLALIEKLLPLISQLADEAPAQACQALLRVAVRSTHLYDFASTAPLLEKWLNYPIAVPGLLNHAKLHSTLGQLYAFQGQQQHALNAFDQALDALSRLSDTKQRTLDSDQIHIYQAVVLQDMMHPKAIETTLHIAELASEASGKYAIERLARSAGNSGNERFSHYLLLRLLAMHSELNQERASYLSQQEEWKTEASHPWMLINTYRAWLLKDAGKIEAANELMQLALDGCLAAKQPMLTWMAYCLHALSQSLGLNTKLDEDAPTPLTCYPADKLSLLVSAENNTERQQVLNELLPFNFH